MMAHAPARHSLWIKLGGRFVSARLNFAPFAKIAPCFDPENIIAIPLPRRIPTVLLPRPMGMLAGSSLAPMAAGKFAQKQFRPKADRRHGNAK